MMDIQDTQTTLFGGPAGGGVSDASPQAKLPSMTPRRPYEASSIPRLEHCHRLEIFFPLNEFDRQKKIGHRMETWPDDPRVQIERELDSWLARTPHAIPRAITSAVVDGACVVVLHWEAKA